MPNASNITNLSVNSGRPKSFNGYQLSTFPKTISISQVSSYFGRGGRNRKTPLKNRLMFTLVDRPCDINDSADLAEFKVPYEDPSSNFCPKNCSTVLSSTNVGSKFFVSQNTIHCLKEVAYCWTVESAIDAKHTETVCSGIPFFKKACLIKVLQSNSGFCEAGAATICKAIIKDQVRVAKLQVYRLIRN